MAGCTQTNYKQVCSIATMVAFSSDERDAVYKSIYTRQDIRRFSADTVPEAILERILDAAHHAPSVGFS